MDERTFWGRDVHGAISQDGCGRFGGCFTAAQCAKYGCAFRGTYDGLAPLCHGRLIETYPRVRVAVPAWRFPNEDGVPRVQPDGMGSRLCTVCQSGPIHRPDCRLCREPLRFASLQRDPAE